MHMFVTVFPSCIEFRLSDGHFGSEPIGRPQITHQDREMAFARIMHVILNNKVETVEIRYENADD